MAQRYDSAAPIEGIEITPTGGLRIPAAPTRVGVLPYRFADGSTRLEYRPPEEVFAEASLASLRGAAVTIGHPSDFVTPENFSALSVGHVGDDVRADGALVRAPISVGAAEAIARVTARELTELSCGYSADTDPTPGVTPDGERFDAIQRNIRYNHVALLPPGSGRAGPQCSLRLDAASAIPESMLTPEQIKALEEKLAAEKLRADAAEAKAVEATKRADAAEAKAAGEAKRAVFRANLIAQARGTKLGPRYLADEKAAEATPDDEIIKAVINQIAPKMDLSGLDHAGLMIALKLATSNAAPEAEEKKAEEPAAPPPLDAMPAGGSLDSLARARPGAPSERAPSIAEVRAQMQRARQDAWKVKGN